MENVDSGLAQRAACQPGDWPVRHGASPASLRRAGERVAVIVQRRPVVHSLYGIRIRTPWPVAGVKAIDGPWDVEFIEGDASTLSDAASHVPREQSSNWAQYAALPDGSNYRRWKDLFEFLVTPDARLIHARTLSAVEDEAMLAYLLVDALSFSMVRLGWEPLHATAVATDRGVAAFLGHSGAGKSTLAASFVQRGDRLVTDDMLVVVHDGHTWLAQPGPPRIKLYRDMAKRVLGSAERGVPMNTVTEKLIIPLGPEQAMTAPATVAGLYILNDDGSIASRTPTLERLSPARAFPRVLANTAAHYPAEPARLTRQLAFAARLVTDVPVKALAYSRTTDEMAHAREAVLADLDEAYRPVE